MTKLSAQDAFGYDKSPYASDLFLVVLFTTMITAVGLLLVVAAVSLFAEPCGANLPLVLAPSRAVGIGAEVLDASFDDWLKNITSLWGMKGLAIAVVRQHPDNTWSVETKGYGVKNAAGDNVTEDVSTSSGARHLLHRSDCALAPRI